MATNDDTNLTTQAIFNRVFDSTNNKLNTTGDASTALDNLASVAINTALISDTDATDDLGSSSKTWKDTYTESLVTDTIAEETAANGVDVDGLNIKDGLVTGGAGTGVSNASLDTTAGQPGGAWVAWTPSWTGMTSVSSSTVDADYVQVGKTVFYRLVLTLGGGDKPNGTVTFTLPVASVTVPATLMPIGNAFYKDSGAAYTGIAAWATTTTGKFYAQNAAGTFVAENQLSATVPFTWADTDYIAVSGQYEAA